MNSKLILLPAVAGVVAFSSLSARVGMFRRIDTQPPSPRGTRP